jgi:ubiquinone/menaquinone biosynthesis C-methylase UbiE
VRLKSLERVFNHSHLRVYFQRKFEAPRALAALDADGGGTCLEIGCGLGAGALLVNQYVQCDRVVCVDVDVETIGLATSYVSHPPRWAQGVRTDNIHFLCEDASRLAFSDCSFDAVVLFGALHHIRKWRAVIAETHRVLKEGGVFALEEALFPDSLLFFNWLTGHVPIDGAELRGVIERAGFQVERFETTKRFEITSRLPACSVVAVKV